MGPVSFERVGRPEDRDGLLKGAQLLRDAGIRVQVVDDADGGPGSLLVRAEDALRARSIIEAADGGDRPQ